MQAVFTFIYIYICVCVGVCVDGWFKLVYAVSPGPVRLTGLGLGKAAHLLHIGSSLCTR